jgi:LPXTG-motif cell wall-anchored protein
VGFVDICTLDLAESKRSRGNQLTGVGLLAAAVAVAATLILSPVAAHAAEDPVDLGTAADFSVLAGSTVTNTGPSTLAQSLGVSPGNTAPGFPPGLVGDETHLGDADALQAMSDLTTAYGDAEGRTPFTNLPAQLGNTTLIPGVYRVGAAQLTGQLTLNAQNDPAAVFIFQISSTLVTASNSDVVFINGASPCNVYWQVGSSATLGTNSTLLGNIMALASITLNTGATLEGRALTQTAAVTLDANAITQPLCAAAPTTAPATPPPTAPTTPTTAPATAAPTTTATAAPTATSTDNPAPTSPATAPSTVPKLPVTGRGGDLTALAATGILLIAGGGILLRCRRRTRP